MAILREDWLKDVTWREMHLTWVGWKRGTIRTEKGRYEMEIERPPDCLMTVRSLEKIPTDKTEKPADWSEIRWRINDTHRIEAAQEKWGVLPRSFPALSAKTAAEHRGLNTIAAMRLPDVQRPLGRLVKRYGWW